MAARRGQPCQNEKQAPQWPLFGEQLHCLQRRGRKREGERKRKKKRKKENPSSNFQEKFMNEANLKSGRSFPRGRDSWKGTPDLIERRGHNSRRHDCQQCRTRRGRRDKPPPEGCISLYVQTEREWLALFRWETNLFGGGDGSTPEEEEKMKFKI